MSLYFVSDFYTAFSTFTRNVFSAMGVLFLLIEFIHNNLYWTAGLFGLVFILDMYCVYKLYKDVIRYHEEAINKIKGDNITCA